MYIVYIYIYYIYIYEIIWMYMYMYVYACICNVQCIFMSKWEERRNPLWGLESICSDQCRFDMVEHSSKDFLPCVNLHTA